MQTLIRSGLSFSRAFELIIESAGKKDKAMYERIYHEVVSGKELWLSIEVEKSFRRPTYILISTDLSLRFLESFEFNFFEICFVLT